MGGVAKVGGFRIDWIEEEKVALIGMTRYQWEEIKLLSMTEEDIREFELEAFRLINIEREKAGRVPLIWHEDLALAASIRAKDLSENDLFDFYGSERVYSRNLVASINDGFHMRCTAGLISTAGSPQRFVEGSKGSTTSVLTGDIYVGIGFANTGSRDRWVFYAGTLRSDPTQGQVTQVTQTSIDVSEFAMEVFRLTNIERDKEGLPPLQWDEDLARAAQEHSDDMARNNYMSHTGLDGSSPSDRIKRETSRFNSWAENVASGRRTPESVVEAWMNSSGHKANILGNRQYLGVGFSNINGSYSWTQKFGQ